jgi:hypothetical protein
MAGGDPQVNEAAEQKSVLSAADVKYVESVSGVASTVLAGFSFATVVVVSADADKYRWADVAIPCLVAAAVAILAAIQCSKFVSEDDHGSVRWYAAVLVFYHLGLIAMMLGLGFALGPLQIQGSPAAPRWVACGMAWVTGVAQLIAFCFGKRSWSTAFRMLRTGEQDA